MKLCEGTLRLGNTEDTVGEINLEHRILGTDQTVHETKARKVHIQKIIEKAYARDVRPEKEFPFGYRPKIIKGNPQAHQ